MRSISLLTRVALLALVACSGPPAETPADTNAPAETQAAAPESHNTDIPTVDYQWDPQAGDKSVSAEMGGPGFTGEGWQTNTKISQLGDPKAPQGGQMVLGLLSDWPATLRMAGKDWNTTFNYLVASLLYEPLVDLDPVTLEFVPHLATHWQISDDKKTYRFRLNPAAKWSDGQPVTADDVVATWKLYTDATLLDPAYNEQFLKFEQPKAISKYIVEVKVKDESWRNFMNFGGMFVFPAHQISTGDDYLKKYQFSFTAVSGPYEIKPENIDTGNSITVTRRKDWWAAGNPAYAGWYNIDSFKFPVVKDPNLMFEKVKKGEIDYFIVPKAQWWAQDIPQLDTVKRGLLVPRKFYTDAPIGISGEALNEHRPPLDDKNVRLALQYLYDRDTMIEKLYYNEYKPLDSYYPGGVYANPNNEHIGYDEEKAAELLEKAGWTDVDKDGYRVKDGKELEFTLSYDSPLSERSLTVFQESCKRAGIKLDLQLLTPAASWKNATEKEFEIMDQAWGASLFPSPADEYSSKLAATKSNNNITGFASADVDRLTETYEHTYDVAERAKIIQQIDAIIYDDHPYVLGWYNPSQRVMYWNKFGYPEWGTGRFQEYWNMFQFWWIDPAKEKALADARQDASKTMEAPSRELHYWDAWDKAHGTGSTAVTPSTQVPAGGATDTPAPTTPPTDGSAPAGGSKEP